MARSQVQFGSQGSDVKELQKLLNKNGYSLTEDGIFGKNTQSAVRDYQKKNGLTVDGIVGVNTWGSLTGGSGTSTDTTPKFEYEDFSYNDYQESDVVTQAKTALDAQLSQKPGEYKSQWQSQLDDTINKILNREKFSYDLNGDALYQQYKNKYIQQGKMAMQDTMGQAAAMTGGYGNSYAQTVGNQAYQASLEELNDIVPELYQMAYDRYNQEGQDLYNQYSMLGAQEEQDYGRYRDSVGDWQTERDYLTGRYDAERDYDYSKYVDNRDFAYGQYADDKSYAYQTHRDEITDAQWQKEFEEARRQYNESLAFQKQQYEDEKKSSVTGGSSSGGSGGGSSGGSSSGSSNSGNSSNSSSGSNNGNSGSGYTAVNTEGVSNFKAGIRTKNEFYGRSSPEKEKYKTYDAYIEGKLDQWLGEGRLTEEEVATLIAYYGL